MFMVHNLPAEYEKLSTQEIKDRISRIKNRLGKNLLILAHHYQSDDIVSFADFTGDSLELSRKASQSEANLIVFCGVHFMAEAAHILAREGQTIVLPDLDAGCPMADMASIGEVESAWAQLTSLGDIDKTLMPVTYINSSAELKAFCGKHGGIVCTSANASAALDWAFARRSKVVFLPDQHLGRNTAELKGIGSEETILWESFLPFGGNSQDALKRAKIIFWNGHCHVHTRFTYEHVQKARKNYPGGKIVVHPECPREVIRASDASGSTGFIVRYVAEAPEGSTILIGTEINLVGRLAKAHPGKVILPLERSLCPNMFKTGVEDLLFVLDNPGKVNVIQVPAEITRQAKIALQNMLDLPMPAQKTPLTGLAGKKCLPCQGGISPMTRVQAESFLSQARDWFLSEDGTSIYKKFFFHDFSQSMTFAQKVGQLAEIEGHHPTLSIGWGYCLVTFRTGKIKGLHENDFIMAAKVNALIP